MVKRCIFPPLSPIANGGNCSWSEHDTYPAGGSPFAPVPHLPPATAAVAAANTARTAALRQREAGICGWLARLLWLGLHVVIIAIACAANPLVAARLRHDMPYTLGLAFILAVNLALYVSLCALDPGFIPPDLQQQGRKGGKEGTEQGNVIQLSPWRHSCRVFGRDPPAESLPVKGNQSHMNCSTTPDVGNADPTFLGVSPSERSGSPYPPLPPPFLLPPSPYNQKLVSPDVCGRIESQQGRPVESGHIQQQHIDPSGSCGVASLGTSVDGTAHLGTSTSSRQYVQDSQLSPASFGSKDRGVSATATGPEDFDPEHQSLLSPSGGTSAAASSADGGGCVGWCGFCKVGQPLYSKHCHDCGRCVLEFDHHCAWLGTCVGARNRCRFWWFLLVQTAVLGWGTAETAVAIPRQGFGTHVAHPLRAILLIWATFTCCLLMVVTAGLLVFNLYLGGKGMTMYQFMRSGARQVGNTSAEEADKSMVSKACVSDTIKNLRRFCCPRSCSRVFKLC